MPFYEFKHKSGVGAYLKRICIVVIVITINIFLVKIDVKKLLSFF